MQHDELMALPAITNKARIGGYDLDDLASEPRVGYSLVVYGGGFAGDDALMECVPEEPRVAVALGQHVRITLVDGPHEAVVVGMLAGTAADWTWVRNEWVGRDPFSMTEAELAEAIGAIERAAAAGVYVNTYVAAWLLVAHKAFGMQAGTRNSTGGGA